jgi:AcrR family transcriptional regulator
MHSEAMSRTKDPAVRTLLIERAAHMLRTREPITLRSLVAGTSVSTMAVYTHFGGMDGMWKSLRQEGFTRLAARFAAVAPTDDPIEHLGALIAVYLGNALDHPDLYRVMFDAAFELEDLKAADETLEYLVQAAHRAKKADRIHADTDSVELAIQTWTVAHGLVSLVANGPLPRQTLANGITLLTALFVSAGDDPNQCRGSIENGWKQLRMPEE